MLQQISEQKTTSRKLTANERRALAEFKKPGGKVDYDKVHGHTLHALQRKKLIEGNPGNKPGWRLTAAGRAELVVPDIFADLPDKEPAVPQKKPKPPKAVRSAVGAGESGAGKAKKSPAEPAEFRPIAYAMTDLHDPDRENWVLGDGQPDGVRLYCTQSPSFGENARWHLQVRAWVKKKTGGRGKHFAVGNASMSREDLAWLRDRIDAELRRKS